MRAMMTPEQFKKRWDSDEEGGGITFNDIANHYEMWGLGSRARTRPMEDVTTAVLKHAGIEED